MKEKINNIQIVSMLFLLLFSCTLGIAPFATIRIAGIDAYISTGIGFIIGFIPMGIFLYIANYEIDAPIHKKITIIFGKTIGFIINLFLVLCYFMVATTMLFNTSNFVISQYLTDTPIILVTIVLAVSVFHAVNKGVRVISKTSLIYAIIIIILFILGVIGIIPEVKLDNLKPVLASGINKPLYASILYSLFLTMPAGCLLMIPKSKIENNKYTNRFSSICYIVTSIIIFAIAIMTSACLGRYLLKIYQYPVYITLKKITIFGFIDRIENFLSIQWILSSFITITLPIYFISNTIKKDSNSKILNLGIIIVMVIVSSIIFKNNTGFNYYLSDIYPYILLGLFIIYFIIFISILIKKCIKKKK